MLCNFCLEEEVAAVNKVEAESFADILVGVWRNEGAERVVLVRGFALYGVNALLAVVEMRAFDSSFSCP